MLQGTLDTFALTDILQFLAHAEKTGALHVHGADTGVVYLHEGEIVFAAARAGDTLGETLVGAGLLTHEAWCEVVSEDGERPLGERLVLSGAIDGERLRVFLQHHVEEALFDQLRWAEGEFQFRVGEEHPIGATVAFPVAAVMAQVQCRLELWATISQRIPSVDVVVDKQPTLPGGRVEVTLSPDEWRLVVAVDGRRSVRELARDLGQGTFQTCYALHGLVEAGLLTVVETPVVVATMDLGAASPLSGPVDRDQILEEVGVAPRPASAGMPLAAILSPTTGMPGDGVASLRRTPAATLDTTDDGLPDRALVRRLLSAVKEL